jgi:osmotically-inducible protein OsmY
MTLSPIAKAAAAGAAFLSLTACAPLLFGGAAVTATAVMQERSVGQALDDATIRTQINHLWFQHDLELYRRIGLTVNEGRVLLTGIASDGDMRLDAVRLAWQVKGVRDVINEIQLGGRPGIGDTVADSWITTQLRSKLTFDKDIVSANYTVETIGRIIYLMGHARSQDELDRVTGHARRVAGVQRVVSYVNL